tara:strand:+ start:658 stop:834 length:177 start_codon:yes stop_codon:yes gene_type:complete
MPERFSEHVMLYERPNGKYKAVSTSPTTGQKRVRCSNCTRNQIIKQAGAIKRAYKARG